MPFALTLVASNNPLSAGHMALAERFFDDENLTLTRDPEWLGEHKAVDFFLSDCLNKQQMDKLHAILEEHKIDAFCCETQDRRKKLLCADMESTIIQNEMLEELADALGLKDKIADITTRSMNGEINFETSLIERMSLLKGLPQQHLQDSLPTLKINDGAKTLVQTMRNNGAVCVLISGGFTFYTQYIAKELEFHFHHANNFEIKNKKLTGNLDGDILGPDAKLTFLQSYVTKRQISAQEAMAIGDGANDLPMLSSAGLGIGYHPKPVLQESLINQIKYGDLSAALFAQGYKSKDFVT